jgi:predicted RNA-binding Zn-ribbon protein involved in translation (DUF1610 family)
MTMQDDLFRKEIPIVPPGIYNCRHCFSIKSVAWIEATSNYICSKCGKVEVARTREAAEKND